MFRIALCQMTAPISRITEEYKEMSRKKASDFARQAKAEGADIICFPEMWNSPYSSKLFPEYAEPSDGPSVKFMRDLSAELGIYIVGGSIPEFSDGKIYNTCFVFNRKGEQIARHRKCHLFDVEIRGGQHFRESDTLTPGDSVTVFDTEFGRMGVIICFDIRFSDFVRKTAIDNGAGLIFVPASFNMTTGPAHWELAIRSRAVDNQIFFAANAPARDTGSKYVSFGNSRIADPWGRIISAADEKETILYGDIDFDMIEDVRAQLPIVSSRRPELY